MNIKKLWLVGKCTLISTIVIFVNIVLNAILIYGYFGIKRMEIAGAALATLIANVIGLIITIYILSKQKELCIKR